MINDHAVHANKEAKQSFLHQFLVSVCLLLHTISKKMVFYAKY